MRLIKRTKLGERVKRVDGLLSENCNLSATFIGSSGVVLTADDQSVLYNMSNHRTELIAHGVPCNLCFKLDCFGYLRIRDLNVYFPTDSFPLIMDDKHNLIATLQKEYRCSIKFREVGSEVG